MQDDSLDDLDNSFEITREEEKSKQDKVEKFLRGIDEHKHYENKSNGNEIIKAHFPIRRVHDELLVNVIAKFTWDQNW